MEYAGEPNVNSGAVFEAAIQKITLEIQEKQDNAYVRVIGNFLLQHLKARPDDADKIMQNNKSIINSLEAMRKVAMTKKQGNMAVLTDEEGFQIVLDYYRNALPVQVEARPIVRPQTTITPSAPPSSGDGEKRHTIKSSVAAPIKSKRAQASDDAGQMTLDMFLTIGGE